MFRPFPLFIAWRHARARRRTRFISVVSAVALTGLALGVTALLVVLSVMNGFDHELRTRILALVPHAMVRAGSGTLVDWEPLANRIRTEAGVQAAIPWIGGTALLSTPGVVRGVELSGIRPVTDAAASVVGGHMRSGSLDALLPGRFGIVLGDLLARSLDAGVGDTVTLMLPELSVTPAGAWPRMRRFEVVGTFAMGAQVDSSSAIIHLEDAARLYRTGQGVHAVRVVMTEPADAPALVRQLSGSLPAGLLLEDWSRSQGQLFDAVRMEKRMVGLLLLVIVAVAAFNIVSILTMVVAEKRGAIAVLRTMGASTGQILASFAAQGTLIGMAGVLAGLGIGIPLALRIGALAATLEQLLGIRLFDPSVYFISYLPSRLLIGDVVTIVVSSLFLCVLATLYPALRAARIGPAEALRYE